MERVLADLHFCIFIIKQASFIDSPSHEQQCTLSDTERAEKKKLEAVCFCCETAARVDLKLFTENHISSPQSHFSWPNFGSKSGFFMRYLSIRMLELLLAEINFYLKEAEVCSDLLMFHPAGMNFALTACIAYFNKDGQVR